VHIFSVIPDIQMSAGHLPLITNEDGVPALRFFWFDAFEDPYKQPGNVNFTSVWSNIYLF